MGTKISKIQEQKLQKLGTKNKIKIFEQKLQKSGK
jgi:hypothetical protein